MGRPLEDMAAPANGRHKIDGPPFDSTTLARLLWQDDGVLRHKYLELFKEDVFRLRFGETVQMERERCLARVRRLREFGMFKVLNRENVRTMRLYDQMTGAVAMLDHSLEVLIGVNIGLFGSTLARLGSPAQRAHWLPKIIAGEEFGCFALTELGHGSNVRGIETTAVFDRAKDAFIITSPTETSQKFWIGGAAQNATVAAVFARLLLDGRFMGIQIFIVRLRDRDGRVLPGITIADCGAKAGLNGVDNGRIWFDSVEVPRANMLSAKSSVARDGTYSSSFKTPDALFAATLAALTGGRVGIAYNSVTNAMIGLAIAVRYAHSRRAFAPAPGAAEVPLIWYTSQQRRLMVPLASAYTFLPCSQELRERWYDSARTGVVSRDAHALSAGFKALFSWYMLDALQKCREACGGQGYALPNRIAVLRSDRDIMCTFEGTNDVLMQQVGKKLLGAYARAARSGGQFADAEMQALNGKHDRVASAPLDADLTYAVFCARERAQLKRLGAQYRAAMARSKEGAFGAWNQCLLLAERASTAHLHRRIFEMHRAHVARAEREDAACARVLANCGTLWALSEIEKDIDFLRLGCINAALSTQVSEAMPALCEKIAGVSLALTNAFEFPAHLLGPIAGDYVAHYSRAKL